MSTKRYPCNKGELGLALKTEMTYIDLGDQKILSLGFGKMESVFVKQRFHDLNVANIDHKKITSF